MTKEFPKSVKYYLLKITHSLITNELFSHVSRYYYIKKHKLAYSKLDLKTPKTFSDKINWIKSNVDYSALGRFVDKYLVREHVKSVIGEDYLIPLIGVYDSVSKIDYTQFPNSFVLKATHGSGLNIICPNIKTLNIDGANKQLNIWLKRNYYYYYRESQYRRLIPRIICEKYLGENINDYKYFCFKGEPVFIQVDCDRFIDHRRNMFDLNWNKLDFKVTYSPRDGHIEKPKNIERMTEVARKLAGDFLFVRVDLYNINGDIYFGELTFLPDAGRAPYEPYEYEIELGELLDVNLCRARAQN